MLSYKIRKLKGIFTATGSCGCGPKATDIIEPIQKPTHYRSSSMATAYPAARCCPEHTKCSQTVSAAACPKIHDSLAVVKDSDDPYQDFRQSMLQMIFEKEIYSSDDLQQLLDCFLQLNSPLHHETIVRAFMEIWNGRRRDEAAPVSLVGSRDNTVRAAGGVHVKTFNSQLRALSEEKQNV